MERKFIRLLMGSRFYQENRHRLVPEMFPGDMRYVFEALVEGHKRYGRELTITDLRGLIKIMNPAMTQAVRNNVEGLFEELEEDKDPISTDFAQDILQHMFKQEFGRRVAQYGMDLMDGRHDSVIPLLGMVEAVGDNFLPVDDTPEITTDIDELLDQLANRDVWKFNIPALRAKVEGAGAGEFVVVLARPDTGKTGFLTTLVAAEGGYAEQGANVHWFGNEEPMLRTQVRCVSACSRIPRDSIIEDPALRIRAKELWAKVKSNIHMRDAVDYSMAQLDAYCRRHKPDIVLVDQLDKMRISGSFDGIHDKLRQIYIEAREIAKRHGCLMIGVCQASTEAEGKTKVTYSMAEGSKTGKGAEADLVIGIGKRPVDEGASDEEPDMIRYLHLSKNKLSGFKGTIPVVFEADISLYRD